MQTTCDVLKILNPFKKVHPKLDIFARIQTLCRRLTDSLCIYVQYIHMYIYVHSFRHRDMHLYTEKYMYICCAKALLSSGSLGQQQKKQPCVKPMPVHLFCGRLNV